MHWTRRLPMWNTYLRFFAFWAIIILTIVVLARSLSYFNARLVWEIAFEALDGRFEGVGTQGFAFALASGLFTAAISLAAAFLVLYVGAISGSLYTARRQIELTDNMAAFAQSYEAIHRQLARHPLIGHAWREFDETLVKPTGPSQPVCNTARPQAFFNIGVAREKLFGLKMMGSIPGYFVGIGLLLTFIGLVLALNKAATGASAADAGAMQSATRELLQVATFKFATSIAGLGASILLSFLFRTYVILIEGSFDKFCHVVEARLKYTAPQSIAAEMNERMGQQVAELKSINSEAFFARMGETISPAIQGALNAAMAPVAASIDGAVARLSDNSQTGVASLVEQFTHSVQSAAGTELKELATALGRMQISLAETQRNLQGTGEDFGKHLTAATEGLERLLASAGERVKDSQEQAAQQIATAATQSAEGLRLGLSDFVERFSNEVKSAAGAELKEVGAALGQMHISLADTQRSLQSTGEDFGKRLTEAAMTLEGLISSAGDRARSTQEEASQIIAGAAAQAAEGMKQGLAEVMERMRIGIDAFLDALRNSQTAIAIQTNALSETTARTKETAEAFGRAAQDVRMASAPFVQSGERIARASEAMRDSLKESVVSLDSAQTVSKELARELTQHSGRLANMWQGYVNQFDKVDQELGRAVETLAQATQGQAQTLGDYASKIDQGFARAIDKLNPLLDEIRENTEAFAESVDDLKQELTRAAAE